MGRAEFISEGLFREIHRLMPIVCVDAVVYHRGKILLLKRAIEPEAGRWYFPGGRMVKGECPARAVKRIVLSETDLAVHIERPLGFENAVYEADPFGHGEHTHTVNLVYLALPDDPSQEPAVKLDGNHTDYIWWDCTAGAISVPDAVTRWVKEMRRQWSPEIGS